MVSQYVHGWTDRFESEVDGLERKERGMTGPELTKIVIMRNRGNAGCKTVFDNCAHESALTYDEIKQRLITAQDRNTIKVTRIPVLSC